MIPKSGRTTSELWRQKNPGRGGPGFVRFQRDERSEAVIKSAADQIRRERDIVACRAATDAAIEFAEVDIKVFRLEGPMRSDGEFEAGTGGPAGIGRASAGKAGSRGLDIAESAPGG